MIPFMKHNIKLENVLTSHIFRDAFFRFLTIQTTNTMDTNRKTMKRMRNTKSQAKQIHKINKLMNSIMHVWDN